MLWSKEKLEHYLSYKRNYTTTELFKEEVEAWKEKGKKFILGSYSATELKVEKLIRLDATMKLPDYELPFTYTEIGKAILETLPPRKRYYFPFSKADFEAMKDNFAGQYANLGIFKGCFVYADIKAFYFTAYSRFLGIEYRRGRRFGIRKHLKFDGQQIKFLKENKRLRNTIFGIMRNTTKNYYNGKKFELVQAHNKFLNPLLANFVYDLSKAIGYRAVIEFGAVYFNTDGAIIPCQKFEAFKRFIESLGFKVEVKATWKEEVIIKGIGVYGSSNHLEARSLHFERIKLPSKLGIRTNFDLDDDEVDFILRKTQFWLERLS